MRLPISLIRYALASCRLVTAAFLATQVVPAFAAGPQRAIPDDNLAYPVLITMTVGTGSGFYINNGQAVYLVTAKHVIADPEKEDTLRDTHLTLLSYSKDPADLSSNLLSADLTVLQKNGAVKLHPSRDVAAIKLFTIVNSAATDGAATTKALPGVRIERQSSTGLLGVALENIKPFKNVLIGNDAMVFGYPVSLGLDKVPQFDSHRPLLRKGIVAGTDPANESIILDCPVYFGNSGGPVLELDRDGFQTHLSIIGVISQYIPFVNGASSQTTTIIIDSNSGYSVATPMDFVLELMK